MVAKTLLLLATTSLFLLLALSCLLLCYRRRPSPTTGGLESGQPEQLIRFAGAEGLTPSDILEAPGEVVGRSSYGTVYRASLGGSPVLLRFLRPAACGADVVPTVRALAGAQHANLVPVRALYVGPRGEKLLVHPYYPGGTLARFLRPRSVSVWQGKQLQSARAAAAAAAATDVDIGGEESCSCYHYRWEWEWEWEMICKLSLGIARGMKHLHTGLSTPIVHGNLKTNNILLDEELQPRLWDFGTHLLLNPAACQEMLDAAAAQGYRAPELVKAKEAAAASRESDIYSLGVVLLEMLTRNRKDLPLQHQMMSNVEELIAQGQGNTSSASALQLQEMFQLAVACCSPSPASRPGINTVVQRLQEIAA